MRRISLDVAAPWLGACCLNKISVSDLPSAFKTAERSSFGRELMLKSLPFAYAVDTEYAQDRDFGVDIAYCVGMLYGMNDALTQAKEVLVKAEEKLRRLIESELAKQEYGNVAKIAPLANRLLNITGEVSSAARVPAGVAAGKQTESDGLSEAADEGNDQILERPLRRAALPHTLEGGYPRFERQGDRLAKVAWSKKDRREYEHRAPMEVIFRIAELFEKDAKRGTPFLMDNLMPLKSRTGDEIPSYQAYLVLAWFRSLGLVEARGKDGYAVVVEDLRQQVERAWKKSPDLLRR